MLAVNLSNLIIYWELSETEISKLANSDFTPLPVIGKVIFKLKRTLLPNEISLLQRKLAGTKAIHILEYESKCLQYTKEFSMMLLSTGAEVLRFTYTVPDRGEFARRPLPAFRPILSFLTLEEVYLDLPDSLYAFIDLKIATITLLKICFRSCKAIVTLSSSAALAFSSLIGVLNENKRIKCLVSKLTEARLNDMVKVFKFSSLIADIKTKPSRAKSLNLGNVWGRSQPKLPDFRIIDGLKHVSWARSILTEFYRQQKSHVEPSIYGIIGSGSDPSSNIHETNIDIDLFSLQDTRSQYMKFLEKYIIPTQLNISNANIEVNNNFW